MAHLLSLISNDASLLSCQVHRLRDRVRFGGWDALGMGYYLDDAVLVAKRPADVGPTDVADLAAAIRSPALVAIARSGGFRFDEDSTDPFRFRQWLFAMDGSVESFPDVRSKMVEGFPDLVRRQIKTSADREHVFGLFLRFLREKTRADDPNLPAQEAARALALAVREIDRLERGEGRPLPSRLTLVATNGRILVAVRRGRPLFYTLQEGAGVCGPCGLQATEKEGDPRIRPHRRAKAVALASDPVAGGGFIEVPDGSTVAIGRGLDITVSSI